MRISDWSSDVCSSDLPFQTRRQDLADPDQQWRERAPRRHARFRQGVVGRDLGQERPDGVGDARSEEHTSELQSLMRISYDVFCLKKKKKTNNWDDITQADYILPKYTTVPSAFKSFLQYTQN